MVLDMFLLSIALLLCARNYVLGVTPHNKFPEGFTFGVGDSAYQVEGAWNEGGKGENMWDRWLHDHPELVKDHSNADVACDHYHKYKEDIQLLKQLGVDVYRFSLSWSRILPTGYVDVVNQAGVDFYKNVIQEMKKNGIEPMVTLYHWDLPIALSELGGWTNPEIVDYFGDYARLCFKLFGEEVKIWSTLNEPKTTCTSGYGSGSFAPGNKSLGIGLYLCSYNHLKAHAKAWHIYNDEFRATQNGKVSINIDTAWFEPANDTSKNLEAQERAIQFNIGLFANAIYDSKGNWPQIMIDRIGQRSEHEGFSESRLPSFTQEEIEYIRGTADYFALNMYTAYVAEYEDDWFSDEPNYYGDIGAKTYQLDSWNSSASDWLKYTPWGLRKLLKWIDERYNHPEIIITENGWSDGGELNDVGRINYYKGYLKSMLESIYEDNVKVIGYTAWCFMDNFEWMQGYTERFGLVHVDFNSQNRTRTFKQSAEWFKEVLKSRCIEE